MRELLKRPKMARHRQAGDRSPELAAVSGAAGLEIVRELGSGGMGVVYLARQRRLGRQVAVKLLQRGLAVDQELVERFVREARTAAALTHASIVGVIDFGQAKGVFYLVMPYLEGGSLQDVLSTRTLQAEEAVLVGRRIAGALQAAHRAGVVHRDVKPSNILLDGEGNPLLADFGVARKLDASTITQRVAPVGTAEYLAPELASGGEPSPASDLYALGATLYESLAGRPPFTGTDPLVVLYQHRHEPVPQLPATLPRELAGAIVQTLAKSPEDRPADATAFVEALQGLPERPVWRLADNAPPPVPAAGTEPPSSSRPLARMTAAAAATFADARRALPSPAAAPRRRRWVAAALALAVLLTALAIGGWRAGLAHTLVPAMARPSQAARTALGVPTTPTRSPGKAAGSPTAPGPRVAGPTVAPPGPVGTEPATAGAAGSGSTTSAPAAGQPPAATLGAELLANGGLEQGDTGVWVSAATLSIDCTGAHAHSGSCAADLDTGQFNVGDVHQDIPVSSGPSESFAVSCWVRSATVQRGATLEFPGVLALSGIGGTDETGSTAFTAGGSWIQVAFTMVPSTSHSSLRLQIYRSTLSTLAWSLWFDDCSVVRQQ